MRRSQTRFETAIVSAKVSPMAALALPEARTRRTIAANSAVNGDSDRGTDNSNYKWMNSSIFRRVCSRSDIRSGKSLTAPVHGVATNVAPALHATSSQRFQFLNEMCKGCNLGKARNRKDLRRSLPVPVGKSNIAGRYLIRVHEEFENKKRSIVGNRSQRGSLGTETGKAEKS